MMRYLSTVLEVFLVCLINQCGSSSQNYSLSPSTTSSSYHTMATISPKPNSAVITTSFTPHSSLPLAQAVGSSSLRNNTAVIMNTISHANNTKLAPSSNASVSADNRAPGNMSLVNSSTAYVNISSAAVTNATTGVNEFINISTTLSMWMSPTVSITSKISGDTSTYNNTFFIEFKMAASQWSSALTTKHNAYINKANSITTKIDQMYMNDTAYEGSYVLGFRKGIYVSVKVKFKPQADLSSLDALIGFLRSGGEEFRTDKVFMKFSQHANCIVNYVDTKVCDCQSMTYKRQITCLQPDVFGGEACPEKCRTGDIMIGTAACSWDDLDAYGCPACSTRPVVLLVVFILLVNFWNNNY